MSAADFRFTKEGKHRQRLRGADTKDRIRFRSLVMPGGCWYWTGSLNDWGYGTIRMAEGSKLAHRVSYEAFVGPVPAGLELDHLCRVRFCVNPDHLEPVTKAENLRRGDWPNSRKTHCAQGHAFDEGNTYVTPNGARACRACARERARQRRETKWASTQTNTRM